MCSHSMLSSAVLGYSATVAMETRDHDNMASWRTTYFWISRVMRSISYSSVDKKEFESYQLGYYNSWPGTIGTIITIILWCHGNRPWYPLCTHRQLLKELRCLLRAKALAPLFAVQTSPAVVIKLPGDIQWPTHCRTPTIFELQPDRITLSGGIL